MDRALKLPSFLREYERGCVPLDNNFGALFIEVDDIWSGEAKEEIERVVVREKKNGTEERLINVKVLDVPYCGNFEGEDSQKKGESSGIFRQLAETKNQEIFQKTAIKALIESKWPPVRQEIINWLLYPYLLFMGVFTMYTVMDLESSDTLHKELYKGNLFALVMALASRISIIGLSLYFVGIELY